MNILFVISDYSPAGTILMGIAHISSFLKKHGHTVDILNFSLQPLSERVIREKIKNFSPGLIGMPILTTYQASKACDIAEIIRQFCDIPIIAGGAVATVDPERIAGCEAIDMICIGEGEYPMLELADMVSEQKDYTHIKNLWIRKNGSWIKNDMRPVEKNLDALPFPDRALFPIKERMIVMAGRGCPYDCSYCINNRLKQLYGEIRYRSPENVISEILELKKNYSITSVWFRDDKFPTSEKWVNKFAELYERFKVDLPFTICIRPEEVNEEQLRKLKKIGLNGLRMGIETADEDIRANILKRRYSNALIEQSFKIAKKHGFRTKSYNMIGIPGETVKSVLRTIALNIKINPDMIQYSIFQPYPGTSIYNECLKKGYLHGDIASVKGMFSESIISTECLLPKDVERLAFLARFIYTHKGICGFAAKLNDDVVMVLLNFIYHSRIPDLLRFLNKKPN